MTIQNINAKVIPVLKSHGVLKASLFGSVARGEANKKSDVDFLVDLDDDKSLLDLVDLKLDLEEKLGRKVDIVEYAAIKPMLRNTIISEQKVIYEKS
ncbi:MAG: nucleotidyltransferase domain-containing protein [Patescibacteria group bacterium]|nr:nucleotidyltransferase domain-containing protein [Patescibacteria group bacterium]